MNENSLKIDWQGTTEYIPFNFEDLASNIGNIRTLEFWGGRSARWVEYIVSISLVVAENDFIFSLCYNKEAQEDSLVIEKAFWGTTIIIYNKSNNAWSAEWLDTNDGNRNGDASIIRSHMPSFVNDSNILCELSRGQKNKQSVTKFLASLGCKLRIGYYWSAKSDNNDRVIFTIWDDQLDNGRYVLLPEDNPPWASLPGAYEMRRHFPIAMTPGVEVLGMRCRAKDTEADTRSRAYYDETDLLVLSITIENGATIATVIGEVSVESARKGTIANTIRKTVDAIYDLDEIPNGVEFPQRIMGSSSGFLRDRMIRDYVVKRSNGMCEYCGVEGFEMPNGRRYIEAHHLIALSNNGADTIANVIGLCAAHHREAHYGVHAERLNIQMQEKLNRINSKTVR